ncbi:MAG: hypothetical protein ABWZ40_00890 [Caulobacterales bacterium]
MEQFQPSWFDKFMMAATDILVPFWMPLVVGSLIAIFAKTLMKIAPIPDGPKNLIMRVSGWVRNAAIMLVLFFFVVLFWGLGYASRESQFYQQQYSAPAQ